MRELFTPSSDTAESFNQDWCLETSAYGGIKFTSGSDVQRGASPLQPISADVYRMCVPLLSGYFVFSSLSERQISRMEMLRSPRRDWKRVHTVRAGVLPQEEE